MADATDPEINKAELAAKAHDMNAAMAADSLAQGNRPLNPDITPQNRAIKKALKIQTQDMEAVMTADALAKGATPLKKEEPPKLSPVPGEDPSKLS